MEASPFLNPVTSYRYARRYIVYHGKRLPTELGDAEVEAF